MRFLMVTTFYPPYHFGGDAEFVRDLSRALVRRGHQVSVIHDVDAWETLSGRSGPPPEGAPDGVETIPLRSRLGALSVLLAHQTGSPVVHRRRLERLFAERRFDVIHFHNVSLVGGPGILRFGDGIKVYTAHEHWLVCPTHVLWRHRREPCDRRQCLRCVLAHRRPPQLWRYTGRLERALSSVDLFLVPSEFARRKHQEFGFSRPMEVLPPFLPERSRSPSRGIDPPPPRPYALFVGRLEAMKGVGRLIEAFREPIGIDLTIVGDGPERPNLERLARGNSSIRFLGWRPREELPPLYRRAIALVVPTIGFETFGMVILEAFREGTPVVARRVGPFPEIVETSGGGLLFDRDEELPRLVLALAGDPPLRERMGAAGRRAFEQNWSEARHIERYLDLVARAASRRSGSPIQR